MTLSLAYRETGSQIGDARATTDRALIDALRKDGCTLCFRHTSTDFPKLDGSVNAYDNCSARPMLSDNGREQAKTIGTAIRSIAKAPQLSEGEASRTGSSLAFCPSVD